MASAQTPASMLEMQHQIRANAANLQDYFSDLYSWEKAIGQEDAGRRRNKKSGGESSAPPPRVRQSAVISNASEDGTAGGERNKLPDAHTYDKGYKRWEKFDVEAALREADGDAEFQKEEVVEEPPSKVRTAAARPRRASAQSKKPTQPKPSETKSRAEIEKEEGNEHYKQGDYVAAIKSYTRCLGYGAQNAVVLSNRAMAFLKNREFAKAEDDCTLALKVDPAHVKSFLRRGTARNALGKHRLALLDFEKSAELDPKNRQIQSQLASTRDLMRAAIKRVPKRTNFQMEVVGTPVSKDKSVKLEIIEEDENENKENTLTQRNKVNAKNSKIEASTHAEDGAKTDEAPSMSQVASSNAGHRPTRTIQLPSLPKKAPTTAYEFTRVWKTFSPKGDADRKIQLLELRARYLRLVQPASLRTIFKNSIESDLLCEIFSAFRQATLAADSLSRADAEFVLLFAQELAQVPRFSMTIMFLSEKEKQDMQWVIGKLLSVLGNADGDAQAIGAIAQLKQAYELS